MVYPVIEFSSLVQYIGTLGSGEDSREFLVKDEEFENVKQVVNFTEEIPYLGNGKEMTIETLFSDGRVT